MNMKVLGLCKELWPTKAGESMVSLRDLVRESGEPDESALLEYLDEGHEILSIMGSVNDALGSDERILGGDNILTDGEWVWRGDLGFYVATYHVSLPDEFLQQVRARRYVMPQASRDDRLAVYEEVRRVL
ncbi:hypothetical protein ACF059_16330 [Streptomyces sp. NPDC016562]|uniref:hypothetical protein n=1 Tax=Streptomyces sp. NPDC016562 TaxID=3364966 RepID=UPI0036FDA648